MPERPPQQTKPSEYIDLDKVNPEEIDSLSRKATAYTLKKLEKQPGKWEELNAKTEGEGEIKFFGKFKEVWSQLAVHGKIELDKEGKPALKKNTDLDGKSALGLLNIAGVDTSNVEYVTPGTHAPGRVNLDTGDKEGLEYERESDTIFVDHHGPERTSDNSTTKIVYEILTKMGYLPKGQVLDNLVEFVTQYDNKKFPDEHKLYEDSWRTAIGLQRYFKFDNLYQFFKDGITPGQVLTDAQLNKYNLVKGSSRQKEIVEKSLAAMAELEKDGFIIDSDRYGKIAVDVGKKVISGYDAAKFKGYDTYINWSPRSRGFFMTSPDHPITDEYKQKGAIKVGKHMFMKPLANQEPLTLTLKEVLDKMTDGKINATGKLKEYLDNEGAKEAEPQKTESEPEAIVHEVINKAIRKNSDDFRAGKISEDKFNELTDITVEARELVESSPAEALYLLNGHKLITEDEVVDIYKQIIDKYNIASVTSFDDLYNILRKVTPMPGSDGKTYKFEQLKSMIDESRKLKSPVVIGQITRTGGLREKVQQLIDQESPGPKPSEEPKPAKPAPKPEINKERIDQINNRLSEIKNKLTSEVLGWKDVQTLWTERNNLESELKTMGVQEKVPEMTNEQVLEEIERRKRFAKDTGRVPGITHLGKSYWEHIEKEFKAGKLSKDQIFAGEKNIEPVQAPPVTEKPSPFPDLPLNTSPVEPPLVPAELGDQFRPEFSEQEKLDNLKAQLDTIDNRIAQMNRLLHEVTPISRRDLENEIKNLQKERKRKQKEIEKITGPSEKGIGQVFKNFVKKAYEQYRESKRKSEPEPESKKIDSILSIEPELIAPGSTAETPQEVKPDVITPQISQDQVPTPKTSYEYSQYFKDNFSSINPDLAQELANRAVELEKETGVRFSNEDLARVIDVFLYEKQEENNRLVEDMVQQAIERIRTEVSDAHPENIKEILTSARLAALENEIRTNLKEAREFQMYLYGKDMIDIVLSNDFYVMDRFYGAGNALWWLGYKYIGKTGLYAEQNQTSKKIFSAAEDIAYLKVGLGYSQKALEAIAKAIAQDNNIILVDTRNENDPQVLTSKDMGWDDPEKTKLIRNGILDISKGILVAEKIKAGIQ